MLLLLFGIGTLLLGLGIGSTTSGLPPESHPCLLLSKSDLPAIRDRLGRQPYASWRRRLLTLVREHEGQRPRVLSQVELARNAKALAAAYLLTADRIYADRAVELLKVARPPSRGGRWRDLDEIIEGAAAHAIAYDLLAGVLRSQPVLERKTRLLVYDLASHLLRAESLWTAGGGTREIRRFSAVGLCAVTLSDMEPGSRGPSPGQMVRRARREVLEALKDQIARDGAYAEGPGRHFQAARVYIPFSAALRRATGEDLLTDEARRACEWSVRIRLPDGLRPNIDHSTLTPSCSYALVGVATDAGLFRWDAERSDLASSVPDDQLPEALCMYDDTVRPEPPPWRPSNALEASGDVVLRSSWESDADYLLLRAERGRARTAGGAYEQADGTSILLARGEEILAMDTGPATGRGGRDMPFSNNTVIMDGEGPPVQTLWGRLLSVGVDVATLDAVFDRDIDAVRVRRTYGDATFERTIVYPQKQRFLVFDHAQARSGKHTFTWLLHVNAGGDTGGQLTVAGNRAVVKRKRSQLGVALLSTAGAPAERLAKLPGTHYLEDGRRGSHAVLSATTPECRSAGFLALLEPMPLADAGGPVREDRAEGRLGFQLDRDTIAIFRTSPEGVLGDDRVCTDGFALCWQRGRGNVPTHALVMGATRLWVGGHEVWRSASPKSAVWRPQPDAKHASRDCTPHRVGS